MKKERKIAPCGFITVRHEDGRNIYHPCVACGLMKCATAISVAARRRWRFWRNPALEDAAQAMAAVATTIQREKKATRTISDALAGMSDKQVTDHVVDHLTKDGTIKKAE